MIRNPDSTKNRSTPLQPNSGTLAIHSSTPDAGRWMVRWWSRTRMIAMPRRPSSAGMWPKRIKPVSGFRDRRESPRTRLPQGAGNRARVRCRPSLPMLALRSASNGVKVSITERAFAARHDPQSIVGRHDRRQRNVPSSRLRRRQQRDEDPRAVAARRACQYAHALFDGGNARQRARHTGDRCSPRAARQPRHCSIDMQSRAARAHSSPPARSPLSPPLKAVATSP